ncbi:MAG: hypothetical protein EOQ33_28050 [Mesorhizobium sp.]|nr:MAG: hypothetical protein EOQ33_28050 [Mesorhizobium sp.]
MRALVWHGKEDIRCDEVTDPEIEDPRDAIVKVTSCAICGSDLHLYHNLIPAILPGDIMGHEMMGEVVDVGSGVISALRTGDRIVVPFTIICGECDQCKRKNFSVCERTNRNKNVADKAFGHTTAGLFGYPTSFCAVYQRRIGTEVVGSIGWPKGAAALHTSLAP